MTKTRPIDGYKVHGRVLIPNGTGPRKAYILKPGYLARPVTTWWHRNASVARLLPHLLKTEYASLPFAWRAMFKQPGKRYRATVFHTVATYKLARCADGGYPLVYLTADNATMCAKCATEQATRRDREHWSRIVDVQPHWEGPAIECDGCNAQIESAYGDPDAESED